MDELLRFIARLLDGEKMAPVCREFGISRKTGYKLYNRYKDEGRSGFEDRPRTPYRHPNKLPFQIEKAILGIKREHHNWGAPMIRDKVIKEYSAITPPAISTIHAVLDRHGRMHLTLEQATARPPSYNFLQQKNRLDDVLEVYNNERPHQALSGQYPGEVYTPSAREYV